MIDSASRANKSAVNVAAQRIAAVYAKALLGAADNAGATDAVMGELDSVAAALERFPRLEVIFASALIPPEEKLSLLDRLFGAKLSPLVLNFLKVLARHGRLEIVRPIRAEAQKLYDTLRGRVRVELRTATAIEDGLSQKIETSLRRIVGGQPEVDPAVDPAVIGGIVLRVGDTIYDGSVARQLSQVREQMITRSIHEIQSRRDRFRHPGGD